MQHSNSELKKEWEVPEIDLNLRHYSGSVCDVFKKIKQDIVNYLSLPDVPEKTRQIYSAIYNALNYYETLSPEFKDNNDFLNSSIELFNEDFEYLASKYAPNSILDSSIISLSARIKSPLSFVEKVKDKVSVYLEEDRNFLYFNESLRDVVGVRVVVNPPHNIKKLGLQAESDYLYTVFYDLMKHRGIENCLVYPSMNKFNFLNVNTRYDTNKLQKLKDTKYPGKFVLATKKPTTKEQEAISSSTCIVKPVTRPDFMEKIDAKVKDYHFYPKKTGYQSIHICIVPPFSQNIKTPELPECIIPSASSDYTIEYQFRDFREDDFSNKGPASHGTLKPFEKVYHRLAIPSFIDSDDLKSSVDFPKPQGIKKLKARNFAENYQRFYGPTFEERFNINYQLFSSTFDEETKDDILAEKKIVTFDKKTQTYSVSTNLLPVFLEKADRQVLGSTTSIISFIEQAHLNDATLSATGTSTLKNKNQRYNIKLYKVDPQATKKVKLGQKTSSKPIISKKSNKIVRRNIYGKGRDG